MEDVSAVKNRTPAKQDMSGSSETADKSTEKTWHVSEYGGAYPHPITAVRTPDDEWLIVSEGGKTSVLPLTSKMLRKDLKSTLRLSSSSIAGDGIGQPRMQELISEILADILAVFRRTVRGTLDPGAPAQDQAAPGLLPAVLPPRAEGDSGFIRGIERALEDALETRLGARDIVAKYAAAFGIPSGGQPQQAAEIGQLIQLHPGPSEAGASHDTASPTSRAGLDDDRQGAAEPEPVGRGVQYISYGNGKAAQVGRDGSIVIPFDEKYPWIWYNGVRTNLHRLEDDGRLHCDSGPPGTRITDCPEPLRAGRSYPGQTPVGIVKPAGGSDEQGLAARPGDSTTMETTTDVHMSGAGHSITSPASTSTLGLREPVLESDQERKEESLKGPCEGSEHSPGGSPSHSPRPRPEGQVGPASSHSTFSGKHGESGLLVDESRNSSSDTDDVDTLGDRQVPMVLLPPQGSTPIAKPGMTWLEVESSKAGQIRRWLQTFPEAANGKAMHLPRFCKLCEQFGHLAGNCHKKKALAGAGDVSNPKAGYTCHNCKEEGHWLRDCPRPRITQQKHPCGFCGDMDHHRQICPWPLTEGPLSAFHHSPLGKECMKSVSKAREALLQAQHDYQEQHAKPDFRNKEVVSKNKHKVTHQFTRAEDEVSSDYYQPPEVLMHKEEVALRASKGNHLAVLDDCPDDLLPPSAFTSKPQAKREAEVAVQTRSVAQKAPNEGTKRAPETPEQKEAADPPKKVKKSPGRPPKSTKKPTQDE
ncbi:unnamed protein product [Sphagnum tenellum]